MQGSDYAGLMAWAQNALGNNQPLLTSLKTGSSDLRALSKDFWNSYGSLPIVCVFEIEDSKYGPVSARVSDSNMDGAKAFSLA